MKQSSVHKTCVFVIHLQDLTIVPKELTSMKYFKYRITWESFENENEKIISFMFVDIRDSCWNWSNTCVKKTLFMWSVWKLWWRSGCLYLFDLICKWRRITHDVETVQCINLNRITEFQIMFTTFACQKFGTLNGQIVVWRIERDRIRTTSTLTRDQNLQISFFSPSTFVLKSSLWIPDELSHHFFKIWSQIRERNRSIQYGFCDIRSFPEKRNNRFHVQTRHMDLKIRFTVFWNNALLSIHHQNEIDQSYFPFFVDSSDVRKHVKDLFQMFQNCIFEFQFIRRLEYRQDTFCVYQSWKNTSMKHNDFVFFDCAQLFLHHLVIIQIPVFFPR